MSESGVTPVIPPLSAHVVVHEQAPTPYHRLYRSLPNYAWWRPLVATVVFGVAALIVTVVLSVLLLVSILLSGDFSLDDALSTSFADDLASSVTDVSDPMTLLLLLLSLVLLLPFVFLALLSVGIRPVGVLHSVALRIRWSWLWLCTGVSFVVVAISTGLSVGMSVLSGQALVAPTTHLGSFLLLAVIIVVLTPFQAAAEEYIFRGILMQAIGSWVRWAPVAIVVPSLLFALAHLQYDVWGMLSVGVMGVGFAIVTWRTGGLEAAIALHTVNNVLAFLLLASGVTGTTVMESDTGGPLSVLITAVPAVAYILVVDRLASRRGVMRIRESVPSERVSIPGDE